MKIIVNGQPVNYGDGLTVSELLVEQKVKMPDMVSVELNGQILNRRTEFGTTSLKDDDKVEFLYFMGGGHCN